MDAISYTVTTLLHTNSMQIDTIELLVSVSYSGGGEDLVDAKFSIFD